MKATEPEKPKFKGYKAALVTGEVVRVINHNPEATLKSTGEKVGAFKVQVRRINGYRGWSGGCFPNYTYGPAFWVQTSKVIGARTA